MCIFGGRCPYIHQLLSYLHPQPQLRLTLTNPEILSEQSSWMTCLEASPGEYTVQGGPEEHFMVNLGLTFPKAGWVLCPWHLLLSHACSLLLRATSSLLLLRGFLLSQGEPKSWAGSLTVLCPMPTPHRSCLLLCFLLETSRSTYSAKSCVWATRL